MKTIVLLLLSVSLVPGATLQAAPSYMAIDVKHGGTIRGKVRFLGDASKTAVQEIPQSAAHCGGPRKDASLVPGKDGGIPNAFVYLENVQQGKRFPQVSQAPILDQKSCEYMPHAQVVPLGSSLEIVNSDATIHNVHAYRFGNPPQTVFNVAMPIPGFKRSMPMDQPGLLMMVCDAGHAWMNAYVMVAPHPYYTLTDKDGNFALESVPPGSYKIRMWRPGIFAAGAKVDYMKQAPVEQVKDVTVAAGGTAQVEFTFGE